ncbi:hypothetical protein Poli38472_001166 [Pythium oligandrum]|uniref:Hexose transporter 1 n=1 Tax=Pythium oligandrum TaxID=41045 RepID=A0A8K1CSY6_PYTOL|nr:hypothetical protein Poli38472_001166 [Pythium oligandrum]|eukprot:TMW69010.1 hypothetical protein Poli38472_001166 [Pythium oligandrum]
MHSFSFTILPQDAMTTGNQMAIAVSEDQETSSFVQLPSPKLHEVFEPTRPTTVNRLVYTSSVLALFQVIHFGWSLFQLNFSKLNNERDCEARPVVSGTCIMFPGHSSTEWLFVVNSWIVGGTVGALSSGYFADRFGRKKTMIANCFIMIAGSIIQASAPNLPVFVIGRGVAGVASAVGTTLSNGYVSEVAPPHLRGAIGTLYGFAVALGVFLVCLAFFVFDSSDGWRYIGGLPIVVPLVFLFFCRNDMVESPAWLLLCHRQNEAEAVLARLYGEENVALAIQWMKMSAAPNDTHKATWKSLFATRYRLQVTLAVHLPLSMQLCGMNAVSFYSSTIFKTAGIDDGRVGNLIIGIVFLVPSFIVPAMTNRFGNRKMLLGGKLAMLFAGTGLTIALVYKASTLSIVFIAIFGVSYMLTLCALSFPTGASVFPDAIRASGMSLMMLVNWLGTLFNGIAFPYIASALDDLAFLPFVVLIVYFLVFMYKYLPNTTGKTNEEIQQLFASESR